MPETRESQLSQNPDLANKESVSQLSGQRLESALEESVRQKENLKLPPISVRVFFGAHSTTNDSKGIEQLITEADIVIPEAFRWTPQFLEQLRKVATGEITPNQALWAFNVSSDDPRYGKARQDLETLYQSHKAIVLIDVPKGHPLDAAVLPNKIKPVKDTFEDALDDIKQWYQSHIKFQAERESFMISQFPEKMNEALRVYPKLAEKEKLKVLMYLGASHTPFYHSLKKSALIDTAAMSFSRSPFIFPIGIETYRRSQFLDRPIDNEGAAKFWLENALYKEWVLREKKFEVLTDDTMNIFVLLRTWIQKFNINEIREIFDAHRQGENFTALMEKRLLEKGLKIPQSKEELGAILAQAKGRSTNSQPRY
jgi:hypothetical protein